MSLSIGPATDYLYAKAQAAVNGVTVNGKPAIAVDGVPSTLADGMFVIGAGDPPPDTASGETPADLTDLVAEIPSVTADEFTIPGYIDVRVPGKVQKAARDTALGVLSTFADSLAADCRLGGALGQGRARLGAFTLVASNVGTAAEPGRRQLIRLSVICISL